MAQQSFEHLVKNNSAKAGWNISKLNDKQAMLKFIMDSGRVQRVYITKFDSILEFSVPSAAVFECLDDIPNLISSILLTKNTQYKIGEWFVENIQDKLVYSIIQNVNIDSINFGYFISLVHFLVSECDKFDGFLAELYQYNQHINSANFSVI
ncbi:hypothetical protein [Okeania sp.]|uniref:hypothetical protein n=1 Tax=Okeania sp. TaxID=3100323 RepID=UPI002B4B6E0C|nr:hypothetical protein [Okeania sp.]MEB3339540.1 hypothetical protein [Okeania sp.]